MSLMSMSGQDQGGPVTFIRPPVSATVDLHVSLEASLPPSWGQTHKVALAGRKGKDRQVG